MRILPFSQERSERRAKVRQVELAHERLTSWVVTAHAGLREARDIAHGMSSLGRDDATARQRMRDWLEEQGIPASVRIEIPDAPVLDASGGRISRQSVDGAIDTSLRALAACHPESCLDTKIRRVAMALRPLQDACQAIRDGYVRMAPGLPYGPLCMGNLEIRVSKGADLNGLKIRQVEEKLADIYASEIGSRVDGAMRGKAGQLDRLLQGMIRMIGNLELQIPAGRPEPREADRRVDGAVLVDGVSPAPGW